MMMPTGRSVHTLAGARLRSPRRLLRGIAAALVLLAGGLVLREVTSEESPAFATVASDHRETLEANIAFWEGRVTETKDSLSYDRLTGLYLQRLRETGDINNVMQAEAAAMASLNANPGTYTGIANLALVRIAQHDFVEAKRLVEQLVTGDPEKADGYAILGDAQAALGDYDAASYSYQRFLELAPGFSAFARQATMAEVRGNTTLAYQFWDDAITVTRFDSPEDSAWARVQLGNLWFATGRIDDAREQYETALRVYPGLVSAEAGLAKVEFASGDRESGVARMTDVTRRVPQADYVLALGEMHLANGNAAAASQQFALLQAIGDLYAANGVRNDFALIQYALDNGDTAAIAGALDDARVAYAERPSVAAADLLAWALYRNGAFGEAKLMSEEARKWGTRDASMLYHAGMIADANGDSNSARMLLSEAIELNPHFSFIHGLEARQTLDRLGGSE